MAFNLNAVNVGLHFIQPNLRATTPQVKVNPMKSTPTITLIFTLVTSSVNAQAEKELLAPNEWPTTVQATVADLLSGMSNEERNTIKKTDESKLIMFHPSLGAYIRNHYGLWRGNERLIYSACGKPCHPDDASMIIIKATWRTLNTQG